MLFIISASLLGILGIIRFLLPIKIESRLDIIFTSLILSIIGTLTVILDVILNQNWYMLLSLWFFGESILVFQGGFILERAKLNERKTNE